MLGVDRDYESTERGSHMSEATKTSISFQHEIRAEFGAMVLADMLGPAGGEVKHSPNAGVGSLPRRRVGPQPLRSCRCQARFR